MTSLGISRALALVVGIFVPIAELYRRRQQLGDVAMFPFWFDDVLIGAFLLYGWWRTGSDPERGRLPLAAAWAFMGGMAYGSFFAQLAELSKPDPSGASPIIVVAIKGIGVVLAPVGVWLTTRSGDASQGEAQAVVGR
jgi:hypothetical protein